MIVKDAREIMGGLHWRQYVPSEDRRRLVLVSWPQDGVVSVCRPKWTNAHGLPMCSCGRGCV